VRVAARAAGAVLHAVVGKLQVCSWASDGSTACCSPLNRRTRSAAQLHASRDAAGQLLGSCSAGRSSAQGPASHACAHTLALCLQPFSVCGEHPLTLPASHGLIHAVVKRIRGESSADGSRWTVRMRVGCHLQQGSCSFWWCCTVTAAGNRRRGTCRHRCRWRHAQ
jgi:hypothetical protein